MKIKLKHIARIEGHLNFIGHLLNGNIKQARLEVAEGGRLIEGILIGRHFSDAPIITARICGICPVIHNLTSIKAIEDALKIKVKPEVVLLRKLMLAAQIIHSHTLHLFFLSLPDFLNYSSDLSQIKKYPKHTQIALNIRNFGNKIIEIIGGRAIHPITTEIGGFKKCPSKLELEKLYIQSSQILQDSVSLVNFFKKLKYPNFSRETNFVSLYSPKEYSIYDGQIKYSLTNKKFAFKTPRAFIKFIQEIETPKDVIKRVKLDNQTYMVGALARLNNNAYQLNKKAKRVLGGLIRQRPINNTFYNIFSQAVEVVHFVEESRKLLKLLIKADLRTDKCRYKIRVNPGSNPHQSTVSGLAACEAPRGTLYHYYEIDKNGLIKKCNIITPTAQFLNNIEEDLKLWLPKIKKLSKKERERKIKMLIRAYDPCITCATH